MKITNLTKNCIITSKASLADTFITRMVGLLSKAELKKDEALVITQCRSIHMFFMRFSIDVIFADRDCKVVGVIRNIRPFQLSPIFFNSFFAIELSPGIIEETKTAVGDHLVFQV